MKSGVYKITNTKTGFIYIGSSKNIRVRFSMHKSTLKRLEHANKLMQEDYKKYGFDIFKFEVIEHCSPDDVIEREKHYIREINPQYNVANNRKKSDATEKQLKFLTTEAFHKEIKAKAVFRGMSIKDYIIRAILRQIQEDNKYQ